MTLDLGTVNWLAVVVGAAIYFILGAVWYSPVLFAKPWQAAIGWDESRAQPQNNPLTYVVPAVLYLIAGVATALLAAATGTDTLTEGVVLGLVTGIGYALAMVGVEATFDPNKPKPITWFGITTAYHLIGFVILAVVIAIWP
jgi:MFS superfamily sulfate permease-like transporter